MRVLITGITGFAGGHLAEALLDEPGLEVHGTSRQGCWPDNLRHLAARVTLHRCDLAANRAAIDALIRKVAPGHIYHLAGYANTGRSFFEPDEAWLGNLTATRALYDAVVQWQGNPRILYVGSGLAYGKPAGSEPFTEDAPLCPGNPYAASKAAADLASFQYSVFPGLDIVRARPFNHFGPRQAADYVVAAFAKQIAAIEAGRQPPIVETGNLTPRRDLTDVRDTVRAYQLLLRAGKAGEVYNVASGTTHAMQEILDGLVALARVSVQVKPRDDLRRTVDVPVMCGCPERLRQATDWTPRIPLGETLRATLDYWRATLAAQKT
ncbi:MAG: GDP-mannose 4,6-dehydratase [Gemmataceae bacterium]